MGAVSETHQFTLWKHGFHVLKPRVSQPKTHAFTPWNQGFCKRKVSTLKSESTEHAFDYKLAEIEYFISWIYGWNRNFELSDWSNPARARTLLNTGLTIINDGPTAERLRPIIRELISLLPDDQAPDMGGGILKQGGQKPS